MQKSAVVTLVFALIGLSLPNNSSAEDADYWIKSDELPPSLVYKHKARLVASDASSNSTGGLKLHVLYFQTDFALYRCLESTAIAGFSPTCFKLRQP